MAQAYAGSKPVPRTKPFLRFLFDGAVVSSLVCWVGGVVVSEKEGWEWRAPRDSNPLGDPGLLGRWLTLGLKARCST